MPTHSKWLCSAIRWTTAWLAFSHIVVLPSISAKADDKVILNTSIYYSALETDYPSGNSAKFRGLRGDVIAAGSREFLKAATVEGTAVFTDGTVLNIVRAIGNEMRWQRVETEFGIDARGCALVPFRSAAVDPDVIPLGTQLMISETRGLALPGGGTHDGMWVATDTGAAITGLRIDLFTGRGITTMRILEKIGIDYLQPVRAAVVGRNLPCP